MSCQQEPSSRPSQLTFPIGTGLSKDEKRLYARQMEVFAAFAEHTDHEVGRLFQAIEDLGEGDNTLFIYVFGRQRLECRRRAEPGRSTRWSC